MFVPISIDSTKLGKIFCLQGINYFNLVCWNCSVWSKHISRDSCWCRGHASLSHKCKFVLCSGDWSRLATATSCTHFHSFSHNTPGTGLEGTRQWPLVTWRMSQFSCKVGNKRGEKQLQSRISVTLWWKLTLSTSLSSSRGRIYFLYIVQVFSRMTLGRGWGGGGGGCGMPWWCIMNKRCCLILHTFQQSWSPLRCSGGSAEGI